MSKSINEFSNILAPEIPEDNFFPKKNDIWSLGIQFIICYLMNFLLKKKMKFFY
jgi:serine/threonine protein kinase